MRNELKHMSVNAVMPNPLRQPRATMSLLVPLSFAMVLPGKVSGVAATNFLGAIWRDLFIETEVRKARKHVVEFNCFRYFVVVVNENGRWCTFMHFSSYAETKEVGAKKTFLRRDLVITKV